MEPQSRAVAAAGEITPSIFKKANMPVTLKFGEVVYKIKMGKQRFSSKGKSEEKVILNGISGVVHPGEMLAMLGPSGSGKTTLLTALGGRLRGNITGNIHYNGKPYSNSMKRNTGFVTQDDVLYDRLTVAETLVYTAMLRLPKTLTKDEKTRYAEAVIEQLGLARCRNSIIGGGLLRGVSGGERKRVSIGQEMLINPSLLFLDEPTSGLDSTTAQKIVSTLWELANAGRTVVMTIHQPSSRLFYMFHKILLISEGNPVYFGKGSSAMEYFSSIGFAPSVAMNPSDFLLDLANGVLSGDSADDPATTKGKLVWCYRTELAERVKEEVGTESEVKNVSDGDKHMGRWSNTWWVQFWVLLRRGLKQRKHETFSTLRVMEVLISTLLCGLIWWQTNINNLQDQMGLLFYITAFWGFYSTFQAIFMFPKDMEMLAKERSSGMYRLSSYFLAKTVGELPMELVIPTISFTITYFMAGLRPTPAAFFSGLFVTLFNVITAQGLGQAVGASITEERRAAMFGSVVMQAFTLCAGFYVQHVPGYISWIKYLSFSVYVYKLMLASQYDDGATYGCGNGEACLVKDFPAMKGVGIDGVAVSVVALVVMAVGYRVIAYVSLMRIGVAR